MWFSTKILLVSLLVGAAGKAHADLSATNQDALSFKPAHDTPVKVQVIDQSELTVQPEMADGATEATENQLCRAKMCAGKPLLSKIPMQTVTGK